jgi:hypothetical protein
VTYEEYNARYIRPATDYVEPDESLTGNYLVTEEGFDSEHELWVRVIERMREMKK